MEFEERQEGHGHCYSRTQFRYAVEFNARRNALDHQSRVCESDWMHSYLSRLRGRLCRCHHRSGHGHPQRPMGLQTRISRQQRQERSRHEVPHETRPAESQRDGRSDYQEHLPNLNDQRNEGVFGV